MRARTWVELQASRTVPVAICAVVALTVALTLLQTAVAQLRLDLWRDRGALESGEIWRIVTPLLIQYDRWQDAAAVLLLIVLFRGRSALARRRLCRRGSSPPAPCWAVSRSP